MLHRLFWSKNVSYRYLYTYMYIIPINVPRYCIRLEIWQVRYTVWNFLLCISVCACAYARTSVQFSFNFITLICIFYFIFTLQSNAISVRGIARIYIILDDSRTCFKITITLFNDKIVGIQMVFYTETVTPPKKKIYWLYTRYNFKM